MRPPKPKQHHGASAEERAAAARPPEVRRGAMYAQIPTEALADRMILPIDKVILGLLTDHDNGAYCCWPTNATLAQEAGCTTRTVRRSLRRLERLAWILTEPCASVPRGQLIRLQWRRPEPGRKAPKAKGGGGHACPGGGRTRLAGGEDMPGRGGRTCLAPNLDPVSRPTTRDGSRPGEDEDADVLSPEELARWQEQATGGDRVQAKLARIVLAKHAEALAAQPNTPGRSSLAEDPGVSVADTTPTAPAYPPDRQASRRNRT
jgi:hypothetical protein